MVNVAYDVLWPTDSAIVLRIAFLYVGQGSSSVVLVGNEGTYKTILIDINLDYENGGINVPQLIKDLLSEKSLDVFVNTHPHKDHLAGLAELGNAVRIQEVWHSGHVPGKDHADAYEALKKLIERVKQNGGTEKELAGSRRPTEIGEIECYVLAPAEYVKEDIEGESADQRYNRIHEQCAVLRFGAGDTWIMIPGDADRDAWENHIAKYHAERSPAVILAAPHHGSRSFFKKNEADDPYVEALKSIAPDYVVISAPQSHESPHDHPHDDALDIYRGHLSSDDDVLHTGSERQSFICDVFADGKYQIRTDNGELVREYGLGKDKGGDGKKEIFIGGSLTRVDKRPMGDDHSCP
jgi:competence protein ComEC